MLRYYEEQGLLDPARDASGYRAYTESDVTKIRQIRGLLDAGLPTEIIRGILPFLDSPDQIHLLPQCLTEETASLLRAEITRLTQRIDCLTRNRDALAGYLAAIGGAAGCRDGGAFLVLPPSGWRLLYVRRTWAVCLIQLRLRLTRLSAHASGWAGG
jgi:DNA-binding transcriptional MerR regulator